MAGRITFSDRYKPAIRAGAVWMVVLGVLSASALDLGEADGCFRFALVSYWVLFGLVLFRRPATPTRVDLLVLKWAFPLLYEIGFLVYPYAMHLRGLA